MKGIALLHCPLLILAAGVIVRAAEDPTPPPLVPPPGLPSREELREKFKGLTPAERQSKLKELREKAGAAGLTSEEARNRRAKLEKIRANLQEFRASIKDLPPAERESKMREWREKNVAVLAGQGAMTPAEREIRRKEFSKRIGEQVEVLKKKQADGILTETEARRLQRMEGMSKRLDSRGAGGGPGGPGLPLPRPPGEKPEASGAIPSKPVKPSDTK